MGHDGAHSHGNSRFDWRLAAGAAVIGALAAGGGYSGLLAGLQETLIWVASVLTVAVAAVGYFIFRATRRGWKPNYVRSIHGPTPRDIVLNELAEKRRELAAIRAMRYQIEASRALGVDYRPDYMRPASRETVVWDAEIVEP